MPWHSERDRLQLHIETTLRNDPNVVACWRAGSQGRGGSDQWSDIDLCIVLADTAMPALLREPLAFVEAITPTVMHIEAPQNAPPGGTHLLTLSAGELGPQHVDWYWIPESSARRPQDTQVIFEHRSIPLEPSPPRLSDSDTTLVIERALRDAVLMAFITGKRIRRNDTWGIQSHLRYLVECVGRAEWIAVNRIQPSYAESKQFLASSSPPRNRDEATAMLLSLVGRIETLAATVTPSMLLVLPHLRMWLDNLPRGGPALAG